MTFLFGSKQGLLSIVARQRTTAGILMQSEARRIQATLAQLAAEGANAGRIADGAVSIWRDIDAALSPIIGQRGVAALFKRSLHLTRADFPALATMHDGEMQPGDFGALRSALSQQTSADAATANGALLQAFCDLLTSLIGGSLAERLLRSVENNLSSGHAVQDTSP
jgi:hypothetical protein